MMISVRKNNKDCIRYWMDVIALSSAEEICLATSTRSFLANLKLFGASWQVECQAFLLFCRATDSEQTDPLGHSTLLLHNDTTRKVEKRGNSGSKLPTLSILKETARPPSECCAFYHCSLSKKVCVEMLFGHKNENLCSIRKVGWNLGKVGVVYPDIASW